MLLPSVFLSISSARLAIYQWYRDPAKAHISTMVTTVSEASVNNSSMGAVSVSLWPCSSQYLSLTSSGNNNKFKTIEECDEMCVENDFKLMLTDKCEQPIEPGPW